MRMFIRAAEIRINSNDEHFGFQCEFRRGLNIIRGDNSSGKSTFVNTLLYGLGLEELVGTKGERALTSAVRDEFQFEGKTRRIDASAVLVEVQNAAGEVVTFRRPIKNKAKGTKLVEAFRAPLLTEPSIDMGVPTPLFLHDGGAAQDEQGFLNYLERFLGMHLPRVQSSNGGLTLLYPQVVAAALFIEQKRGWSDYIANIPFYQILSAPTRVVQYLLGLDNFRIEEEKARNQQHIAYLQLQWSNAYSELNGGLAYSGISVRGIPKTLVSTFLPEDASLWMRIGDEDVPVKNAIAGKLQEWHAIEEQRKAGPTSASPDVIELLERETQKLESTVSKYEELAAEERLRSASLTDLRELLREAEGDLKKNKTDRKLRELGAPMGLATSRDECPTCGSATTTLTIRTKGIQPMSLEANIEYLEAQVRMLRRQTAGLEIDLGRGGAALKQIEAAVSEQRSYVVSIRKRVSQSDATLEIAVRKQVTLERDIHALQAAESRLSTFLDLAPQLASRLAEAEREKSSFPRDLYSKKDRVKISILEKYFRANASSFDYSSVPIPDIRIDPETLMPALDDLTLRQVFRKKVEAESSASDFVRLIWAFLIALYQTSNHREYSGNHPGAVLFDEPGQHSMSHSSQRALMMTLSGEKGLQSIVAASFDDSDVVFATVTQGSKFHLLTLPEKVIGRLAHDGRL